MSNFNLSEIINSIDNYVYNDKNVIEQVRKEYTQQENQKDPYYFHDKKLIAKYKSYTDIYNNIKENDDVCCICIDNHNLDSNVYFKCKHFVCVQCFEIAKMKFGLSQCPLCRCIIERCIFNNKYAIIALGTETKFNTFENGGYKSISIVYIPEYQNVKGKIIENIKYHDNNKPKEEFEIHLLTLMVEGYIIVFQNFYKVKRWLSDILLKDFIYNETILHE